jgi:SAM-dependent methyltransferase
MGEVPEAIYLKPRDYDLEHVGDTDDIAFFVELVTRLKPKRVLELACGNGRVTLPLAEAAATKGFHLVGMELVPEMLQAARQKREAAKPKVQKHLELTEGDMRSWKADEPFDLIVTPCSSMCHLLTLDDQLAAWKQAHRNLKAGGRFVVDVTMPNLAEYIDSFRSPPREIMEIDLDTYEEETRTRLIRHKTTRYFADKQRAHIRFLYNKYIGEAQPEHSISDFESHIYYPREMELLFLHTGFQVEAIYGDYHGKPLGESSPQMIFVGVKQ